MRESGLSAISFQKLQWLFPIAVALHNGEEALTMPGWNARHTTELASLRVPLLQKFASHPPSAEEIRGALLVLTLAAFAVTWLCARAGKQSLWAYLLFGGVVTMLVNVFVPHVPATLLFGEYTPGVVTAVLINLPLMNWLALRAVREQWVIGSKAVAFGAGVPITIGGVILGWLRIIR